MGLRLVYLVVSRLFAWARLATRDSGAKDVEILMLRHQLAVAQRRDPRIARKLTWADRAWLALLAHATRRVRVLGATSHPTSDWVVQQARNVLVDLEDTGVRAKFLLHDRDASFGAAFDAVFTATGIQVIRTGIRAPRQNSIMERWFRSLHAELTDRTLIWNLTHLMRLLREYEQHHNTHRPHRTLGQAAPLRPLPDNVLDLDDFRIRRRDRAGGVLHEYAQVA